MVYPIRGEANTEQVSKNEKTCSSTGQYSSRWNVAGLIEAFYKYKTGISFLKT